MKNPASLAWRQCSRGCFPRVRQFPLLLVQRKGLAKYGGTTAAWSRRFQANSQNPGGACYGEKVCELGNECY